MTSTSLLLVYLISSSQCELSISETPIPSDNSLPQGISVWRGERVFFCESAKGKVGVLEVSTGTISEVNLPLAGDDPVAVSVDTAGFAWVVTSNTNSVRRINSSLNEVKSWTPQVHEGFSDVEVAPNGLIWLANRDRMSVGTLDTNTGLIKEFDTQGMNPYRIAVDKQRVWFTDPDGDKVAFLVPDTLALTTFAFSSGARPAEITLDEKGHAWVALLGLDQIVEIDPSTGETKSRSVPTPGSGVYGIAVSPDGKVWFTESSANKIGRYDPSTDQVTEISIPTPSSYPSSIAVASDGRVWFVEENGNKIGCVVGAATFTSSTGPSQGPEGLSSATLLLIVAVGAVAFAGAWAYRRKRTPRLRQQSGSN